MLCDYGRENNIPCAFEQLYVHTHQPKTKQKEESFICHDFMCVIVLTVHKSRGTENNGTFCQPY